MCQIPAIQTALMTNALAAFFPDTATINRHEAVTQTITGSRNPGALTVVATVKCWILPADPATTEAFRQIATEWTGKAHYTIDFPQGTDARNYDTIIEQSTGRKFYIVSDANDIGYSTELQCLAVELT